MGEIQMVWGWQPALYLFLGGMGAGAFIMAAVLGLKDREGSKRTVCVSFWAAVASLCIGLLLLVTELVFPLRGLMLWQSFSHFTSWMTIGAWVLFAAVIVFGLMALFATEPLSKAIDGKWLGYAGVRNALWKPLSIVGILLGLGVAVYTGVLLMSVPGTPLWNTPLLPCLFTVSALDTGIALVEVVSLTAGKKDAPAHDVHKLMYRCVVVLVLLEAIVLAVFMGIMMSGAAGAVAGSSAAVAASSAELLLEGQLAPVFWILFVACGLALPFIAAVVGLAHGRGAHVAGQTRTTSVSDGAAAVGAEDGVAASTPVTQTASTVSTHGGTVAVALMGALGALAGGCALRFLILMAGVHADPIAETAITLLF